MSLYSFLSIRRCMNVFHKIAAPYLGFDRTFRRFPTSEERHLEHIGITRHT